MKPGTKTLSLVRVFAPQAKTLADGTVRIPMNLTVEAIASAKGSSDPAHCPVAQALRETGLEAVVINSMAFIVKGTHVMRLCLGSALRKQVAIHDAKGKMTPGTYWLIPPGKTSRIGYKPLKKRSVRRNSKKRKYIRTSFRVILAQPLMERGQ